jgi:hypothetical protein
MSACLLMPCTTCRMGGANQALVFEWRLPFLLIILAEVPWAQWSNIIRETRGRACKELDMLMDEETEKESPAHLGLKNGAW